MVTQETDDFPVLETEAQRQKATEAMDSGPVRVRRARGFMGAHSQCRRQFPAHPTPLPDSVSSWRFLLAAQGTVFHSFL